ncbi:MAG TPA: TolC family protein [Nitrospira sp.]|nr:TolC family protein [Nitrospira sp.]
MGIYTLVMSLFLQPGLIWGLEIENKPPSERREVLSLADAALQALQHNFDIRISRRSKESRLTDITVERAKFDPTLSVKGEYTRLVTPLNQPLFGGTGSTLTGLTPFDQREFSLTVDAKTNLPTGGNIDVNYNPTRTRFNADLAQGFLFNPAYLSTLSLTFSQPLLRNAGLDITATFIRIAQNNATVEEHIFRDRVLTILALVEQTYWEVVFANENLKVAEAAMKAARELLASNRAKEKEGMLSVVDVLQAEAAVASRVEQVLVAEKTIRDQEDQLRKLLNPGEGDMRQETRLMLLDQPVISLEPLGLQEAIDTAIAQRPEILQAMKNVESSNLNTKYARNQILPSLSLQATMGLTGLGKDYGDSVGRNFNGDFYNYGVGLILSYPLGNRSAWGTYNRRKLEAENAEESLASVRQQIIVGVREAVRRVETDFKRIESTRAARIMSEKQLQVEHERLKVGLSITRFVLDSQRDLATAQGHEVRAIVDYNKSLSNLARHKATTLDRYNLQLN